MNKKDEIPGRPKGTFASRLRQQASLQVILLLGLLFLAVFSYVPMVGIIISFKEYKLSTGLMGFFTSEWVGFKWFIEFFTSPMCFKVVRNTLVLSLLKLAIAFPAPILFALLLNEIHSSKFKRLVQTASYLPHFISWIIVSGLCFTMFSSVNGLLNELLLKWGWIDGPMTILTDGKQYWGLAIGTEVWKEMGWNAIIYLSAMAGIDQGLYEAAKVDGANRFQRIWHVTLPCIRPTVIVLLIMSIGSALNVGMERQMLLSNSIVQDHAMVLSWFAYVRGIGSNNYGLGTAIGVFQSVVGVILLFLANKVAGMIGEDKLV